MGSLGCVRYKYTKKEFTLLKTIPYVNFYIFISGIIFMCGVKRPLLAKVFLRIIMRDELFQFFCIFFLFQKWTEPVEKISRELSQAEEANMKNRKRLRGIALAIQSVISLLYLVRSRNNTNIDIASTTTTSTTVVKPTSTSTEKKLKDDNAIMSSPNISRIPRPTSAMASPSCTRKSPTTSNVPTANKKRTVVSAGTTRKPPNYDQPDYSLKKGFLKREEKVDTGTLKKKKRVVRSKISVPTTPVRKPVAVKLKEEPSLAVTAFKDKQVRFRPSSVIDVRVDIVDHERPERPGSAQGYRSRKPINLSGKNIPKSKENKTTIIGTKDASKNKNDSKDDKQIENEEKSTVKPKHENSADNIVGEVSGVASNGVKLRKKTPRSRSNSMMDLNSSACLSTSKESVSSSTSDTTNTANNNKINNKEVETKKSNGDTSSSRRHRPVSLMLSNPTSSNTRKALTPSTDEFNRKRLQYRLTDQLHAVKKENPGRVSPKRNSKFKLSNLSSPRCRSPTRGSKDPSPSRRTATTTKENVPEHKQVRSRAASATSKTINNRDRSLSATRRSPAVSKKSPTPTTPSSIPSSPKKTLRDRSASATRSSLSATRKSSNTTPPKTTAPQADGSPLTRPKSNHNKSSKNGGSWNPGTNIHYREPDSLRKPLSPKKKLNSSPKHVPRKSIDSGKVHITTEVNKRKNITFPDGKKVDRETNTKTTVSVDMTDGGEDTKAEKRANLLAKVKTLAQEIGSLSSLDTTPVSEGSSDSIQADGTTPVRSNSDMIGTVIKEETDRFSETEYLSLSERS